ncbi:hypothetical protein SODG_001068 [Sodalis praecaptivus]|nr:hypothetical protein NVIRENTERO_00709 [Sodalis praecaptivus]
MHLAIEDKVALVCGGGSGLGRAIALALALAAEGVTVAVTGRTPGKLDETVALITGQGGRAQAFALDLSQPETFDDVLSAIRQTLGPIGILVNNLRRAAALPGGRRRGDSLAGAIHRDGQRIDSIDR